MRSLWVVTAAAAAVTSGAAAPRVDATVSAREAYRHRRLVTVVNVPGTISAPNFLEYIDTPGDSAPVVSGKIVGIKQGEQATYIIDVPTAGNYMAEYQFGSAAPVALGVGLVYNRNCYNDRMGKVYSTGFSTPKGQMQAVKSKKRFHLNAGTQKITLCFWQGPAFGGFSIYPSNNTNPVPRKQSSFPAMDSSGCYSQAVWQSTKGAVRLNNYAIHIKGISWFGFDTTVFNLNGLWATTVPQLLDTLKTIGINLLRLPLSLQLSLNPNTEAHGCGEDNISCPIAAKGNKRLAWDQLEYVIDQAALRGMLVVLDMHNLSPSGNTLDAIWYNDIYSEEQFIQGWVNIVGRFKVKPNVIGLDIFNEPHAQASWGIGKTATDFGLAVVRIIEAIDNAHPDYAGLYFVEGVQLNSYTPFAPEDLYNHWWGGNLDALYRYAVYFTGANAESLTNRLVYSPHVYGPSVFNQTYFNVPEFPGNMPAIWDRQLGFIERVSGGRAVVIGEWGGQYVDKDKMLQNALTSYLREKCIDDSIWWSVNPNGGNTGGLFTTDWVTMYDEKVSLLQQNQPTPTFFTEPIAPGRFCINYGEYANPRCKASASWL